MVWTNDSDSEEEYTGVGKIISIKQQKITSNYLHFSYRIKVDEDNYNGVDVSFVSNVTESDLCLFKSLPKSFPGYLYLEDNLDRIQIEESDGHNV